MNTDINVTQHSETQSAFVNDDRLYNKQTQAVPKPQVNIGIDSAFYDNIIGAGLQNNLDISEINNFTHISERRNELYKLLDTMANDSIINAILETHAEDATEPNDNGQIVWCESDDSDIAKFVTFLLDTMNVDKNIYQWAFALCKYGDVYLRLFRKSDYDDDEFFNNDKIDDYAMCTDADKKQLHENININVYSESDPYSGYVEMHANPAEMYELIRHGKTSGYIQADAVPQTTKQDYLATQTYKYNFKKNDINIYEPTEWVHGCLIDNSSRVPEEVSLFLDDNALNNNTGNSYIVKRGQSILYSRFKIWRQLALLENSMMLNRLTKSAVYRVVSVEIGDMPKEKVPVKLQSVKSLMEQKSAISSGESFEEYTNPGPLDNTVYIPTRNGIGAITTQQVGGDIDVRGIADIDYYNDALFGSFGVPKAYFGKTDDGAGFNGGQSLSIISSRYAKRIKRIQNALIQMITDAVNLMCLDKGLRAYIGKFTIKMLPPTTQEEIDRRDNVSGKIQLVSDVMNMISEDVENNSTKLSILKSMLANVITNNEVIDLLQTEIDKLEEQLEKNPEMIDETDDDMSSPRGMSRGGMSNFDSAEPLDLGNLGEEPEASPSDLNEPFEASGEIDNNEETILPSPAELNMDFTNNEE